MEIEYIGEVLIDGKLPFDPAALCHLKKGQKLRITIRPLADASQRKIPGEAEMDAAAKRFLARMGNAPRLGQIKGDLTREDIYEDMADERF